MEFVQIFDNSSSFTFDWCVSLISIMVFWFFLAFVWIFNVSTDTDQLSFRSNNNVTEHDLCALWFRANCVKCGFLTQCWHFLQIQIKQKKKTEQTKNVAFCGQTPTMPWHETWVRARENGRCLFFGLACWFGVGKQWARKMYKHGASRLKKGERNSNNKPNNIKCQQDHKTLAMAKRSLQTMCTAQN